jgi:hypothetical protein
MTFPRESFAWIYGEPKRYYYYVRWFQETEVAWTERTFCERCGTQLTHRNNDYPPEDREKVVRVNIISLDDPNAFPPRNGDWLGGIDMKLSWVPLPRTAVPELIKDLRNEHATHCHPSVVAALKQIGTSEALKAVEEYERQKQAEGQGEN